MSFNSGSNGPCRRFSWLEVSTVGMPRILAVLASASDMDRRGIRSRRSHGTGCGLRAHVQENRRLAARVGREPRLPRREGIVNAWADANFKAAVEATGRKNLIMAGVTTDVCLVFPAIDAVTEGYNV
jgi:hypothetical protein